MTTDQGPASTGGAAADPVRPEPAELGFADPVSAAASLSAMLATATDRFRQTAASLSAEQARQPSQLPGWSRGHVLAHLARNADSLRNLLIWARTGVRTPQYPDQAFREQGIEAGAGRSVAEQLADLDASAAALAAEAASLSPASWAATVEPLDGPPHPAWYTMWRRLTEVELHHVDLAAGYGPADWPQPFAVTCLRRVAGDLSRPDAPAVTLASSDGDGELRIGPPDAAPEVTITGPAGPMLAWLTGRGSGTGLTAKPAGPLPSLPSW